MPGWGDAGWGARVPSPISVLASGQGRGDRMVDGEDPRRAVRALIPSGPRWSAVVAGRASIRRELAAVIVGVGRGARWLHPIRLANGTEPPVFVATVRTEAVLKALRGSPLGTTSSLCQPDLGLADASLSCGVDAYTNAGRTRQVDRSKDVGPEARAAGRRCGGLGRRRRPERPTSARSQLRPRLKCGGATTTMLGIRRFRT